jgi:hypothetical protein
MLLGASSGISHCSAYRRPVPPTTISDKSSTRTKHPEEPHMNPKTGTKEFALLDPDGYYVMISALSTG